ncbi:MAG: sodium:solute symporter [Pyrinomonadaceae bacterium]
MRWLDWIIVAGYLVYVVWDGIRLTKKSDNLEGFFLAGRGLPWWAVGLSVMATQASAITLVGTTGQGYDDGMKFVQTYYALPFAMIILCVTAVPFFHRARVYTAYQYLENRFDLKTRTITSMCFLMSRGLALGVVIAAPAVILSIVLGWNEIITIFAIGATTTVYTMFGGVQAVTWTDVKQMILIFFGLGVCLLLIVSSFPSSVSVFDGLHLAGSAGRLTTIDTSFDLKEKYTIWTGLFAALFLFLSYFGCDQSQVQRFLTAKSVDEGRTSLLMSAYLKIPMQAMILLIGVMVFVFYQFSTPPMIFDPLATQKAQSTHSTEYNRLEEKYEEVHKQRADAAIAYVNSLHNSNEADTDAKRLEYERTNDEFAKTRKDAKKLAGESMGNSSYSDVNYVFPTFILSQMPMGVVGLLIAAIFAAAMSSISAELNALATDSTIDFYRRHFNKDGTDAEYVRFGKLITIFWGGFACLVAIYATNLGSLIEVVNKFGSYFYGSVLGVFVLAFAVKRARARGAFWGLIIGMIFIGVVSNFTDIAFLWFNLFGCLVTVTAGYLISLTTD